MFIRYIKKLFIINFIIKNKEYMRILIQDSNLDLDIRSILLCHWANKRFIPIITIGINKTFSYKLTFIFTFTSTLRLWNIRKRVGIYLYLYNVYSTYIIY